MPAKIAAAVSDCTPTDLNTGIRVAPTVATQPAPDGVVMLIKKVNKVASGMRKNFNPLSGLL
ncbi:hypothetical protein CEP45_07390 [Mergibacter septicus]|nr:hypothetical protein CEP45_07390 [Mergibacter septicus]